jgi:HD-like signal output (HDOD) protein
MFDWIQRIFSAPAPAPAPAPTAAPAAAPKPAAPVAAAAPAARPPAPPGLSFDQRDGINSIYQGWLFGAAGDSALDTSEPENQVLDAVTTILKSQQSGAALVRRLPGLIPQLLQSLRSDNFSGAQLSRTISNDVVLVAAVIRLANTSYIGSGTSITSVEHAVMLIGQEGLRHLITSVAFRPIIDLHSGQYTRLLAPRIWDQSERCAVANRILAEDMGINPFEAFLAGLVQNVGLIVTLRIMDQMSKGEKELGSEMFCARLVRDARILTCSIGREWHFPESVVTAIGEQAGMRKGVPISPLGHLLTQSDYLSKVRILVDNARLDPTDPVLFKGLSPAALACYRALDAVDDEPALAAPAP